MKGIFDILAVTSIAVTFSPRPLEAEDPAPGGPASQAPDAAVPAPDAAAQAASLKLIKGLYKDDYARAKTPAAKLALARKLLAHGAETRDDPAARYVLFLEARDLATEAGDSALALAAIDEISKRYLAVSALDMKVQALDRLSRSAKAPEALRGFAVSAIELTEEALRVNNYPVAKKAAQLAASAAGRAKSAHLAAWAAFRSRQAAESEKEHEAAREAAAVLRQKPGDPDACLAAGRFRALLKGEWDAGLALLAKGADPDLKTLAEVELTRPEDPTVAITLGDDWSAAAEKLAAPFKARALLRAAFWYERAFAGLQGLTRTKCEEKLSRVLGGSSALKAGLVAELFEGRGLKRKKKVRIDRQIEFDWGLGPPEKDLPADRFSIRWTGSLRAAVPGKYTLTFQSDDGLRFWLDGELLVDRWAWGYHREQVAVYLTDRPHELRLEYYEESNPAKIILTWMREGSGVDAAVPPYAFTHDSDAERKAKG